MDQACYLIHMSLEIQSQRLKTFVSQNQRGNVLLVGVRGWLICLLVVYSLSHVQLFCNSMNRSQLVSSVHGISQARILKFVAISFPRGSSQPRDRIWISCVSCIAGGFFTTEPLGKPPSVFIDSVVEYHEIVIICFYSTWTN